MLAEGITNLQLKAKRRVESNLAKGF